jgi:hypothetical protein
MRSSPPSEAQKKAFDRRARARIFDRPLTVGACRHTDLDDQRRAVSTIGHNRRTIVAVAPTFYVVPGSTVKNVIDNNKKRPCQKDELLCKGVDQDGDFP